MDLSPGATEIRFTRWARTLKQENIDHMKALDSEFPGSFATALRRLRTKGYIDDNFKLKGREPGQDDEETHAA